MTFWNDHDCTDRMWANLQLQYQSEEETNNVKEQNQGKKKDKWTSVVYLQQPWQAY